MNKQAALARLGLSGSEDNATVARVYGERLTAVQERLVSAQTDAERADQQARMAEVVEAYECVTASGRYTKAPVGDAMATIARDGVAPPSASETFVRMEPGAVLSGRLEIGQLLGQGGMGNVYAARDRLKDEDVAIKVLRQDLLSSAAAKDRFLAEAKVSCSLSHPNIVNVHDVGVSGNYYYFSMERLKGHTLRQRMEAYRRDNREFGVAEVTDIARQLLDALRYAHRYIVHRDIKPENIWLTEDGTVKLMDFGIARAYSNSQLTQTGMTLGTAYYMAPEQRVAAKEFDWRADQYALGVVLYELFAGTLPTGAVQPLENLRRDVPKRCARALMRAMSPKPEDRFPSLNELLAEIEAPSRKVAGTAVFALIGVGLAAAAVGAFLIFNNQSRVQEAPQVADAATGGVKPASAGPQGAAGAGTETADGQPPASTLTEGGSPPANDSGANAGGSTTEPPPSSPDASTAVAAAVPETQSAASVATPAGEPPPTAPAKARAQPVAKVSSESSMDLRRKECVAQCERDDGECRSINRRGKQDCMRAVAFGSSGKLTTTNPATASCAFFGQARCDYALNRDACLTRITGRYNDCVNVLSGNVTSRRQDCDDNAREADKMCLDELRECRESCR